MRGGAVVSSPFEEVKMKYMITYWTNGDVLARRVVETESMDAAIELLKNDPQEPLAQLKDVRLLVEENENG